MCQERCLPGVDSYVYVELLWRPLTTERSSWKSYVYECISMFGILPTEAKLLFLHCSCTCSKSPSRKGTSLIAVVWLDIEAWLLSNEPLFVLSCGVTRLALLFWRWTSLNGWFLFGVSGRFLVDRDCPDIPLVIGLSLGESRAPVCLTTFWLEGCCPIVGCSQTGVLLFGKHTFNGKEITYIYTFQCTG